MKFANELTSVELNVFRIEHWQPNFLTDRDNVVPEIGALTKAIDLIEEVANK